MSRWPRSKGDLASRKTRSKSWNVLRDETSSRDADGSGSSAIRSNPDRDTRKLDLFLSNQGFSRCLRGAPVGAYLTVLGSKSHLPGTRTIKSVGRIACATSGDAAAATGMTTFAIDVRRCFHRFALGAAIFLSVTHGTRTIGMRTFFVTRHW